MPAYKAIGQVGLGGYLYAAAANLMSKVLQNVDTGAPIPERPARYTPGVLSPFPSPSSQDNLRFGEEMATASVLSIPNIPQNITATIMMPSLSTTKHSTLWTMILSLWATAQAMFHFLTEQCGEFVAELMVQLLFVIAIAYLGNRIDQGLRKVLGHPKPPTVDDCIDEEAPANSLSIRITRATIDLLHRLADRIQYRINNLEAIIANIIVEGKQAIRTVRTELDHAKKTITSLEGKLRDMINDRDRTLEEARTKLESSAEKIQKLEADLEEFSIKHDDAMEDSQTKLEEADKKLDKLDKDLNEAVDKIAKLEADMQRMANDRDKAANDEHTAPDDTKKRIGKLEAQCKYWQSQLEENQTTTAEKIAKAVTTANNNAERARERLWEVAKANTDGETSKLKTVIEKKENELVAARNQSAHEIAALKEALAKKEEKENELVAARNQSAHEVAALKEALVKKEDKESGSSFNPAAKEFTPHQEASSGSTRASTPHSPLPTTRFSTSPSYRTTQHQQTPVKKEELPEEARRNLDEINKRLSEQRMSKMMGKPAEDEEVKPLSGEELDRKVAELSNKWKSTQQHNPMQPAFAPGSIRSTPIPSMLSRTPTPPELAQHTMTPEVAGQPPNHPAPPTGPKNPGPAKRQNYRGLKPGAPGTPPIQWPEPDAPKVEGAPTAPRAMRRNNGRPSGLDPCFIAPKPRPGRGNFNGRGRGDGGSRTRERPQLPAFLRKDAGKEEAGKEEKEEKAGKEGEAE